MALRMRTLYQKYPECLENVGRLKQFVHSLIQNARNGFENANASFLSLKNVYDFLNQRLRNVLEKLRVQNLQRRAQRRKSHPNHLRMSANPKEEATGSIACGNRYSTSAPVKKRRKCVLRDGGQLP